MTSLLAIQIKRIGDLVVTLPALEAARQAFPKAHISLVIDGDCAEMAPAIQCADEVLVYRKNALNLPIWKHLLGRKFDAALDFTGTDRSAFLAWVSRATDRLAFQSAAKSPLRFRSHTRLVDSPVRDKHTADHLLDLVQALGKPVDRPEPGLFLPENDQTAARQFLQSHSITPPYIVLHPGAARAEYWPAERWAEVADYCHDHGLGACLIIGGRSEMERRAIHDIRTATRNAPVDASGRLSLLTSAAVIAGARLLIGIDSGPSHLAAALRTPQITLFGPTNPFHWRPRHDQAVVLQGGKSNPLQTFEPHATPGGMNALSTAEVIHAINLLLPQPSAPL